MSTEYSYHLGENYYPLEFENEPGFLIETHPEQPFIAICMGTDGYDTEYNGYIKIPVTGKYHFMVEADDSATFRIFGKGACMVTAGRLSASPILTLENMEAGFYKVQVEYSNAYYNPVSMNASALKTSMTGPGEEQPLLGDYSAGGTDNRKFSVSPAAEFLRISEIRA